MSKTLAILLGLALVWLTAWQIAGYYMRQAGTEQLDQAEHVSTPATRLERGAEVRVEGTVVEGPSTLAPYSQKPCLAAITSIFLMSSYRDIHDRDVHESNHIATRRVGPASIEIAVGDKRVELPLERWSPRDFSSESVAELPPRLGVTPQEIESAKQHAQGSLGNYRVSESTIQSGARFFVVGRLEDRDGPLRLEPDRMLGRIELYPGSQDALVKELSGSGRGLRVAGWILAAGVGSLPLAIVCAVLLARRRKRPAPVGARPPG